MVNFGWVGRILQKKTNLIPLLCLAAVLVFTRFFFKKDGSLTITAAIQITLIFGSNISLLAYIAKEAPKDKPFQSSSPDFHLLEKSVTCLMGMVLCTINLWS